MKLKRIVREGTDYTTSPWPYGKSHYEIHPDEDFPIKVTYPIPLNLFVSFGRRIFRWLRSGVLDRHEVDFYNKVHNKGFAKGYNDGRLSLLCNETAKSISEGDYIHLTNVPPELRIVLGDAIADAIEKVPGARKYIYHINITPNEQ